MIIKIVWQVLGGGGTLLVDTQQQYYRSNQGNIASEWNLDSCDRALYTDHSGMTYLSEAMMKYTNFCMDSRPRQATLTFDQVEYVSQLARLCIPFIYPLGRSFIWVCFVRNNCHEETH